MIDAKSQIDTESQEATDKLLRDDRWQLVQRILASSGFQRAEQLRGMLQYVTRIAILRPEESPQESEIAKAVMKRRPNFDPAYDNIVRVQAIHLRKKLKSYFNTEGAAEHILLTIPAGTYLPHFQPMPTTQPVQQAASAPPQTDQSTGGSPGKLKTRARNWTLVGVLTFSLAIMAVFVPLFVHRQTYAPVLHQNLLWRSFALRGDAVSVVLPDNSLMQLRQLKNNAPIALSSYLAPGFLADERKSIKNPDLQELFDSSMTDSNASITASMILTDLNHAGVHADFRHPRSLRVEDLYEGNFVFMGNYLVNPWISIFADHMNYQSVMHPNGVCFVNLKPQPDEPENYFCGGPSERKIDYVDVALLNNLSNSGQVLFIDGSGWEASRSAIEFLDGGRLPAPIINALSRPGLASFELLLRGERFPGQANDVVKVASYRIYANQQPR